jgi:L-iditol 2-dehydrogenase
VSGGARSRAQPRSASAAAGHMLAVRVHGPGDLRVDTVPVPVPASDEALVRVLAAGVCATDRKLLDRGAPGGAVRTLGHEIVAEVVVPGRTGPEVGSRVAVAPNLGCGQCRACAVGATNLCPAYQAFGIHLDGGMAEYLRVPRAALERGHLLPVPAALPTLEAVALEPLACCVEGLLACGLQPGERVLIVGAGVMGRLHVAAARALGAGTVMVSDIDEGRLAHARELGADVALSAAEPLTAAVAGATDGHGADVVAVTIGVAEAASAALASLARGGRLNLFAGFPAAAASVPLDANDVHYRRLQVVGTSGATLITLRRTLDLLASRRVALAGIVSSVRGWDEAEVAFREAGESGHARVVLTPGAEAGT